MKASPILLLAATTLHLASPALSWNPFGWLGHHKHPSFSYTCEKSIHPYFNPGKMTEVLNAACPAGLPEEGSAEGPMIPKAVDIIIDNLAAGLWDNKWDFGKPEATGVLCIGGMNTLWGFPDQSIVINAIDRKLGQPSNYQYGCNCWFIVNGQPHGACPKREPGDLSYRCTKHP